MRGMPTIISIRAGTLDRIPDLRSRLGHPPRFCHLLGEASAETTRQDNSVLLGPHHLCHRMKTTRLAVQKLDLFVFPKISRNLVGARIIPLGGDQLLTEFKSALFPTASVGQGAIRPGWSWASVDWQTSLNKLLDNGVRFVCWELGEQALLDSRETTRMMAESLRMA